MRSPLHPTFEDSVAFVAASLVTAAAYYAFTSPGLSEAVVVAAAAFSIILAREIGQRMVAYWMDAYINLEFSQEGSGTTLFFAFLSVVTDLNLLALFPLTSSFSGERYEHWGKSVDAIWSKRQYWLVLGGIVTMFGAWTLFHTFNMETFEKLSALFIFFQLLPFDYWAIPTDRLDGVYIILQSGLTYLLAFGVELLVMAATFA